MINLESCCKNEEKLQDFNKNETEDKAPAPFTDGGGKKHKTTATESKECNDILQVFGTVAFLIKIRA